MQQPKIVFLGQALVMVHIGAVPTSIAPLQRRVIPLVSRILSANDNPLASVAQRPHLGGTDLLQVGAYVIRPRRIVRWYGRIDDAQAAVDHEAAYVLSLRK